MSQQSQNKQPPTLSKSSEVDRASPQPTLVRSLLPTLIDRPDEERVGITHMYDVDPNVWGRHFWSVFHLMAYAYPEEPAEEVQQAMYQFFDAMRVILPCGDCCEGFREQWAQFDIRDYLDSRESLICWIVQVHDSVNEKLGKDELDYPAYMERLIGENVVQNADDEHEDDDQDGDDQNDDDDDDKDADDNLDGDDGENSTHEQAEEKQQEQAKEQQQERKQQQRKQHDTRSRSKSLDSTHSRSRDAEFRSDTRTTNRHKSSNPTAFSAAIHNAESLRGMDPKRLRSRQASAFAQARRFRDANSKTRQQQRQQQQQQQRWQQKKKNNKQQQQQRGRDRASAPLWKNSSLQATQDYYTEMFQRRGASQSSRAYGTRRGNIGKLVKPPRDCENCNRKVLVPSVFS